ncbi:uncharacterized protein LOC111047087 [Nilaparvata lugens]|uniref:uncharacterized protein LOC111047087 n=1 Tax=Nilaparvata lugens TaxID=108931 RepID=UPI000B995D34|nr:uncharacterized protein LOC111047087 [Nilaparvata lugens]
MKVTTEGRNTEIIKVYAPQTGCDDAEKTQFQNDLEQELTRDNILIIGDLNAQVGEDRRGFETVLGPFGYGRRNTEGEQLLDLCIRNNLIIKNSWFKKRLAHKITRYSWNGEQKTLIDYVIADREAGKSVIDVKVIPSENLDSDHRLLVTELKHHIVKEVRNRKMPRIKTWELDKVEKRTEFRARIVEQLPRGAIGDVEAEWNTFKTCLVETATKVCGKTSEKVRDKETKWWNDRVRIAIKDRNKARRARDKEKQKTNKCDQLVNELEAVYREKKLSAKRRRCAGGCLLTG